MKLNTLNSRLRSFYNAGFTKEDIDDLIDVDDFFPSSDLTDSGYISSKLSQSKIDEIGEQLPKFKDIRDEMNRTIYAEENPKMLPKSAVKQRIADEFRAKNKLLNTISEAASRYYNLVKEIASKYNKDEQKAEALLISTKSGMALANANSRAGQIQHWIKDKPVGSYKEAYDLIKDYESLANNVLKELDAMYKGTGIRTLNVNYNTARGVH